MDFGGGFAGVRMRVAWDSAHMVVAGRWTMGLYIVFAKNGKKSQLHVLVIYYAPRPKAILPSSCNHSCAKMTQTIKSEFSTFVVIKSQEIASHNIA